MSTKSKKIKVTLTKSTIAAKPVHKETVRGLGLKRVNHSVVLQDTACTRGMINQVSHLLLVEDV